MFCRHRYSTDIFLTRKGHSFFCMLCELSVILLLNLLFYDADISKWVSSGAIRYFEIKLRTESWRWCSTKLYVRLGLFLKTYIGYVWPSHWHCVCFTVPQTWSMYDLSVYIACVWPLYGHWICMRFRWAFLVYDLWVHNSYVTFLTCQWAFNRRRFWPYIFKSWLGNTLMYCLDRHVRIGGIEALFNFSGIERIFQRFCFMKPVNNLMFFLTPHFILLRSAENQNWFFLRDRQPTSCQFPTFTINPECIYSSVISNSSFDILLFP